MGQAAKPWIVMSTTFIGGMPRQRARAFRTYCGAQLFKMIRDVFYLMPHPNLTFCDIRKR